MHFLSHTHETEEIGCFLVDAQITLLLFFNLSNCLKVVENAGAFIFRCSELLGVYYAVLGILTLHPYCLGIDATSN